MKYVEKHEFYQLFTELMTECFEKRIENPRNFIAMKLSEQQMKKEQQQVKVKQKPVKKEQREIAAKKIPHIKAEVCAVKCKEDDSLVTITRTLSIEENKSSARKRFKSDFKSSFESSFDETAESKVRKVFQKLPGENSSILLSDS
jgi:hypothetical protein